MQPAGAQLQDPALAQGSRRGGVEMTDLAVLAQHDDGGRGLIDAERQHLPPRRRRRRGRGPQGGGHLDVRPRKCHRPHVKIIAVSPQAAAGHRHRRKKRADVSHASR